jgi:hypothetical protein
MIVSDKYEEIWEAKLAFWRELGGLERENAFSTIQIFSLLCAFHK